MMYVDNGLRLATAEVVPNGGAAPGGLGPTSVALGLDPSGITSILRSFADIGSGRRVVLAYNVDTAFTCATFGATLEFQLVSIPINASLLTDATTTGKTLTVTLVAGTVATDLLTIAGHGLPLGTPIFLTAFSGGPDLTGIVANTIYYVIPVGANSFQVAASLADAVAQPPVPVDITGSNGTVTVNFIPTIHAASGMLPLYNVGTPTNQGPLRLGTRFQVPLRGMAQLTPRQRVPTGQTLSQPLGAGPTSGLIAGNAQRFYYLRYVPSNTITAGAVTCDLVLDNDNGLQYYPSGVQVI